MTRPTIAVSRPVSDSLTDCELTHLERRPIDVDAARRQHGAYEATLSSLGIRVVRLPALHHMPDAVFVEDTALVLEEAAVVTRPGAESRRGECESTAVALSAFRKVFRIEAPVTLDGGDVLRLGRRIYVGLSSRSTEAGVEALSRLVHPMGYDVIGISVSGCLHLKSAVTQVDERSVLVNPDWVDPARLEASRVVEIAPSEPAAANVLSVRDRIVVPASHPLTTKRLRDAGLVCLSVDVSELALAEGGVTCCSLLL